MPPPACLPALPQRPALPATVVPVGVTPGGVRTVINNALANPTGVLVGPDGAIYVSNKGNLAGQGEVLRIVP